MFTENLRYKIMTGMLLFLVLLSAIAFFIYLHNKKSRVDITNETIAQLPKTFSTVTGSVLTESEFIDAGGTTDTYQQYSTISSASNSIDTVATKASGYNLDVYNICDANFKVLYGYSRISPLFPMALANVETPGRADNKITWSSLYPSAVLTCKPLDVNVTSVFETSKAFDVLTSEYSTRDRGPLQMSPTYGTGNAQINSQMYYVESKELSGYMDNKCWVAGASNCSGDRFNIHDICLRLTAAMEDATQDIVRSGYQPSNDMQLLAMLAVYHNSSGIWNSNGSASCGAWVSHDAAFKYIKSVTTENFINRITALTNSTESVTISSDTAKDLYVSVYGTDYSAYTTNDVTCNYAIKFLYAYIKLSELY